MTMTVILAILMTQILRAMTVTNSHQASGGDHPRVGWVKQSQGSNLLFSCGMGGQCSFVTESLRSLSSSRPDCILCRLVGSKSLLVTLRSGSSRGEKQERGKGDGESEHFWEEKVAFAQA